jgi:hypothetical protein
MDTHPCPECGHKVWKESYVSCEDCGDHTAVECLNCFERFDHVWGSKVYDKVCASYGVKHAWDIKHEE